MTDTTTSGVNTDSAAGNQPASATPDAATSSAETAPIAPDKDDSRTTVPVSVIRALRNELKTARDQVRLYQSRLGAMAAQGPASRPESTGLSGLSDDQPVTVGQIKKLMGGQRRPDPRQQALSRIAQNPEAAAAIRAHLPGMLKENPGLARALAGNDPVSVLAEVVKLSPGYKAAPNPGRSLVETLDRLAENATRPGSASQASGGAGLGPADRFSRMSDSELEAHIARIKSGK